MKLPHGSLIRKLVFENGLNTVLISNPDFKNTCLSLSVAAGSCDEPKEYPGLAHLLEHCIFHAKHPKDDKEDLRDFIVMHSGTTNAYTTYDKTTYFFKISPEKFSETTDRFLNHIKNPHFCLDGLDKGIKEVDSEHRHSLSSNENRVHDLLITFLKDGSVDKRFQCGNRATLSSPNVYAEMIKFYETNYSSDRMNLVISGKESLDTLTAEASKFIKLEKKEKKKKKTFFQVEEPLDAFKPEFYEKIVEYEQKVPDNALYLFINLHGIDDEIPTDCLNFFQFILNDKSKNSLTAMLRAKQLAFSVHCSFLPGTDFFLSKLKFDLTHKGKSNYKEVLEVFGSYLENLIPSKESYNRYKAMLMHNLNQSECLNQLSLTYKMSYLLHYHTVNSIIKNTFKLSGFKKSDIQTLVKKHMQTSKWMVFVGKEDPKFEFVESNSETRYNVNELTIKRRKLTMSSIAKYIWMAVYEKTSTRSNIKSHEDAIDMQNVELVILNSASHQHHDESLVSKEFDYGELHHFLLSKTYEKKADVYLHFITDSIYSKINMDVYLQANIDAFEEKFDLLLKTDGTSVGVVQTDAGSAIKFTGVASTILKTIQAFANFFSSTTPVNFNLAIEERIKVLNELRVYPYKYAERTLSQYVLNGCTINKEIDILTNMLLKDSPLVLENYYLKIIALGFLDSTILNKLYNEFSPKLRKPLASNTLANHHIVLKNSLMDDDWVARYYLIDRAGLSIAKESTSISFKKRAIGLVIHSLSEALFFNNFRTKQQSGYIVICNRLYMSFGYLIAYFIQSKTPIDQIKKRIDEFIEDFKNYLQGLTEQEFKHIRNGAVSMIEEVNFSPSEISKEFFQLSSQNIHDIHYKSKLINALKQLSIQDLLENDIFKSSFYIDYVDSGSIKD